MIKKLLSLILLICTSGAASAQTFTVYENTFEDSGSDWTYVANGLPNYFIRNACALNGPSAAGDTAVYITPGGSTPDCSPTGMYRYTYENAIAATGNAVAYIAIDATCTGTLQAQFDYKIDGVLGTDFAELVYSTDNGVTFNPVSVLNVSSVWTQTTINLPALLDFSTFIIGLRFNYDNATITGSPLAFDNFKIIGVDTGAPVINSCQTDLNITLDGACSALIGDYTPTVSVTDNCSDVSKITFTQSPLPNTVMLTTNNQTQLVTITVTDLAGNSAQCSFTATAIDATFPTLSCPGSVDVSLNASCEAAVPDLSSVVTWSDNCTTNPALITYAQTPVASTMVTSDQNITINITDEAGNMSTCVTLMNIVDDTAPILTCPADQILNGDATCSAVLPDYTSLVNVVENCFVSVPVSLVQSPAPTNSINSPSLITISGTDESGNVGTCTFTVYIADVIAPTVNCPADATISTGTGCNAVMPDVTGSVTFTDNCASSLPYTITQSPLAGSNIPVGPNTISVSVTDTAGNSGTCNYVLTVADLTLPDITCNGNVTVSIDANCSGTLGDYTSNAVISDNCTPAGSLTIVQSPASGTVITSNTQITLTVTDGAGNANSCNFFAIVDDNTDPSITCPGSYTVAINSSCAYTVPDLSSEVSGTDNCSSFANMTLTQNPTAGSPETGMTAVLLTLTDENGNQGTCVTMLIPDDTETPTVTCPSPSPINNGSNCDFILPNYGTTTLVLDNCSNYTITQQPAPGTTVQTGQTTIDITVSDVAGNMANCSFTLEVFETVPPTISCPGTISTCDPNVVYLDPTYNDNCDAILTQTDMSGLSSGSTFPVGNTILEYTVTDLSGNSANCSFVVQILDYPAIADIVEDTIELCNLTSTVVSATAHTTGQGEWTVTSGTGNFNNQFASTTGVNNLTFGTNVLYYTISTASCGSSEDSVYVITYQQPLPASTQDELYACGATQIALLSNTPLYGEGVWTTSDASASIADPSSSNTTASNLSSGWHDYIWTITNGSCPSTSDTMRVFVSTPAEIYTADTVLCFENQLLSINASIPGSGETSFWKFIKGVGVFSDATMPSTMVTDLNLGENIIVYTMNHPMCPSSTDTLIIVTQLCAEVNPDFPTVITPNHDGKNDLFVINNLEKIFPDLSVIIFNRWGSVVFESTGYEIPWDGTHNGEELPMGTYFYKIELNDTNNTVYTGPISIIH